MTTLHIAMFSDTYLPYVSGAVRSIERLSEGLRERGHEVTIFAPAYWNCHQPQIPNVQRTLSLPIYPPANIVLPLPRPHSTLQRAQQLGIDIIHAHSPATMGRTAIYVARHLSVPVLFTHHSVYHEYACYAPTPLQPLVARSLWRWMANYCHQVDQVIAPSANTQELIHLHYGLASTVISNPIPLAENNNSIAAKDLEHPILLYVGRLAKEKNLSLLIRAFAEVRSSRAAHLVLVGDGPERKPLAEKVNALGLQNDVTFTGVLPFEQVVHWYAKAALFMFASTKETQGMVILEALAHGVPAVAVRSPVNQEVLEPAKAGWLTKDDPTDMAAITLNALSNATALQEIANRGRSYASRFTTTSVAAQMEDLYTSLLS